MSNEEKHIEEMGMSGYSKLAWKLWDKTKLPMTQCEVIEQVLKEQGYRKASDVARETIGEAIEVVRHFFDEAKMRADHETNVLLRCQLRGEQIGASLVEYALAELKKKYESEFTKTIK